MVQASTDGRPAYLLRHVVKTWSAASAGFRLVVPELRIERRRKVAVVGVSGCGKSTLLDILGLVLSPAEAACFSFTPRDDESCDIKRIWAKKATNRLADLRKRHIGYVTQTGALLSFLSVRDNIALSRRALRLPEDGTVETLALRLGIADHLDKLPKQLSVGERQRVAVARALAHRPAVIIADEPTASLDPITASRVMETFMELADEVEGTVIVASHDRARMTALGLDLLHHEISASERHGETISRFWT